MAGIKSQVFRFGLSALWYSGAARVLAPWTAGRGAILMLHRVQPAPVLEQFAPNAALSITPGYLDALLRGFRRDAVDIVGLDEALRRLAAPAGARRFVCFTFDDGYRDNLEHALPVFRRHGAPFTVYVTTGFVDRTLSPWWCVLERIIADHSRIRWLRPDGELSLSTGALVEKERAFAALAEWFLTLPVAQVRAQIEQLAVDHDVDALAVAEREICSWEMLRELRAAGVELGCHTVHHAVLARESAADARQELLVARARLEAELATPVVHLAYPYGKRDHAGAREFALARELGFATATTTRKGALFDAHGVHPHALPRVELTPSFASSTRYARTILSGLPLIAWNRGRRVIIH
jgi:peptidoglycan/xylan/chitin deacetylase (PgdA/CDA1 family)